MLVESTEIPDVLHIVPREFTDPRGAFFESFCAPRYAEIGITRAFVQDNVSISAPGVLRGLHLQHPQAQGKLVSVLVGEVLDVAVDVRVGSPTFGQHVSRVLTATRHDQLWIPEGFAHGFCVLSAEPAVFVYKCTDFYSPGSELTVRFDDPDLGIDWPLSSPLLSKKDSAGLRLRDLDRSCLPRWERS